MVGSFRYIVVDEPTFYCRYYVAALTGRRVLKRLLPRAMPWAECSWALTFPSAVDRWFSPMLSHNGTPHGKPKNIKHYTQNILALGYVQVAPSGLSYLSRLSKHLKTKV